RRRHCFHDSTGQTGNRRQQRERRWGTLSLARVSTGPALLRRLGTRLPQPVEEATRGPLRGDLLGAALGLARPVLADADLDGERLRVFRPALAHDRILRLRQLTRLRQLL